MKDIESLLKNSLTDTIIWEQNGTNLVGKYVYMKYEEEEIGLFMGFALDSDRFIRTCVTFIFPHPSLSIRSEQELNTGRRLFYKILIRANLKLSENPFMMVSGRKLPAIMRTLFLRHENTDIRSSAAHFFSNSINAIKRSQPVYKILT